MEYNYRYLPVMITRLMISLRKAAHSQELPWSMGMSVLNQGPDRGAYGMRFAPNHGPSNRWDDDTLVSPTTSRA